jgi:hypothetical protein
LPATKRSGLSIPRPILPKPSHPMVDCCIFELFDVADQSNTARRLQFGYGSSTPPTGQNLSKNALDKMKPPFLRPVESDQTQPPRHQLWCCG